MTILRCDVWHRHVLRCLFIVNKARNPETERLLSIVIEIFSLRLTFVISDSTSLFSFNCDWSVHVMVKRGLRAGEGLPPVWCLLSGVRSQCSGGGDGQTSSSVCCCHTAATSSHVVCHCLLCAGHTHRVQTEPRGIQRLPSLSPLVVNILHSSQLWEPQTERYTLLQYLRAELSWFRRWRFFWK